MIHLQVKESEPFRSYEFSFGGNHQDGVLVAAERFELEEQLKRAVEFLKPPPFALPRGDRSFFDSLLEATSPLLPRGFPQELSVSLETDEQRIPWELVFPDSLVVRSAGEEFPKGQKQEATAKVAVCAPSVEVFPWCESELAVFGRSAERLEHGVDLLLDCPAGFAYLVAGLDEKGAVCLPEPLSVKRWLPRQLNRERQVPSVLFLRLIEGLPQGHLLAKTDEVARGLLQLGIPTVITTYWEPDPQTFPVALATFYETLTQTDLTRAFTALREALSPCDLYLSRYSLGLYGRLDVTAEDLFPRRLGSKLSATTVAGVGKPDFRIRIVAGPDKGRVIPVFAQALHQGKRLVVGSPGLKRCQIEIEDPSLANEAVQLELEDETLYLTSLCPTPEAVRIEGLPVYKRVPLRKTLTVESGDTQFVVELGTWEKTKKPHQVEKGRFHLLLSSGPEEDRGLDYSLTEISTTLGREGGFPLHDPSVSRRHALILERDGSHHVCPLGQAQVVLNGVPVEREAALKHTDLLQLSGLTTLQYVDTKRL